MGFINKKIAKEVWTEIIENFSSYGSIVFHFLALIFVFLLDINLFLKLFPALAITYILVAVFRMFYFKKRPKGKKSHENLVDKVNHSGIFSTHSAASFVFALIIGFNTNTALLIFLLIFAFLIVLSRLKLKEHYVFDVLTGSALGIIIGLIFSLV